MKKGGMPIANIGLYEYEILPEEKNALAVTILRSVGELGDWGYSPPSCPSSCVISLQSTR